MTKSKESIIHFQPLPFCGDRRLNIALVGMANSGKNTLFQAVSSTAPHTGELSGTDRIYNQCDVQIGLDEACLIKLPSLHSLHHPEGHELETLKFMLWGDERPPVSSHESSEPPAPFSPPDVIIQLLDASNLERHLELTMELSQLGRPMVLGLNMIDEAERRGFHIDSKALSDRLGIPVIPINARMGLGLTDLFNAAAHSVRKQRCLLPQSVSPHISTALQPLAKVLNSSELHEAFQVPHAFLLTQFAEGSPYIMDELQQHFPQLLQELHQLRNIAEQTLPRTLDDELHADRHHQAALLSEAVTRPGRAPRDWRKRLDDFFLHPQLGLLGSLVVFAAVLFVVFEVSGWLDSMTSARLAEWAGEWQPTTTNGVIAHAILDGLIGLIGIVVPYMLPLVLLLVGLEQTGIMHRIAFVVDRGFHRLGLHGGMAFSFLLGLGCNVPAISSAAIAATGRERVIASLLITFVPCSARSAVILALAGKYLGGLGIFAIFMLTLIVIAVLGHLLTRRYPKSGPGQVQEIPPYAMPQMQPLLATTWARTSDILTIVTPLLVGGSVVLALLSHFGADEVINTIFTPITVWWLGLPLVLGVPILFGVLRKELSLLMIYQALGTFDIGQHMDWLQLTTFLLFLTFYVPCISTFAVMLKTIGRKEALFSVMLSVGTALVVAGVVRFLLEAGRWIAS